MGTGFEKHSGTAFRSRHEVRFIIFFSETASATGTKTPYFWLKIAQRKNLVALNPKTHHFPFVLHEIWDPLSKTVFFAFNKTIWGSTFKIFNLDFFVFVKPKTFYFWVPKKPFENRLCDRVRNRLCDMPVFYNLFLV